MQYPVNLDSFQIELNIERLKYVKEKTRITNTEYQKLFNVKKRQAADDLKVLEDKEIFTKIGNPLYSKRQ